MGYRPEDQGLKGSCEKIIEGIDEFNLAVLARADSDDGWLSEHITKIAGISEELVRLRYKIREIQKETW